MKQLLIFTFVTVLGFQSIAQKADNFTKLPGGVEYLMAKDVPGTVTPQKGDYADMHMYLAVDGNMIYNSRAVNGGNPLGIMMSKPSSQTDMQEVIKLMSAGDSAIVRMSVDSMIAAGSPKLEWMKPNTGQKAIYMVKMLNVRPMGKKEPAKK